MSGVSTSVGPFPSAELTFPSSNGVPPHPKAETEFTLTAARDAPVGLVKSFQAPFADPGLLVVEQFSQAGMSVRPKLVQVRVHERVSP